MSQPGQPAGYPTDAHVARPGTSDALTARTIDATPPPPLVRAKETVVGVIPRVADAAAPFASPLFLGLLSLTLIFVWVAHRRRYRPSALLLGVLLVMGLTSFRPVEKPEPRRVAITRIPRTMTRAASPDRWSTRPPEAPGTISHVGDQIGGVFRSIPVPRSPEADVSTALLRVAERMRNDEEVQAAVQDAMEQLRYRLRDEARRQRWRRLAVRYRERHGEFEGTELVLTR